ncbi:MAG TPA: hypothetical protein VGD94_22885 [Vicinamibacterales bacterium]
MSEGIVVLIHKLNNQLGIILANAELLEAKLQEDAARARASQLVASALEAMSTAREIRLLIQDGNGQVSDTNGR